MADEQMIAVDHLVKVYRETSRSPVRALDGLSLNVRKGEIFGLLGRNGAGKTTLLRVLTTLIRPTGGTATVCGHEVTRQPLAVRQSICAVLQENAVEVFLSVLDNLITYARFHSIPRSAIRPRAEAIMAQFGLEEYRNQKVIDLSGGLKRRVQVAKVFMVDKPVVFLDEATTGMDPVNKRATLDAIRHHARQGRTILLTTHILHEAEELCDRIAIIDSGRCIASGDLQVIKALAGRAYDVTVTFEELRPAILETARRFPLLKMTSTQTTLTMSVKGNDASTFDLLNALASVAPILHFEVTSASLEDVFLELLEKPRAAHSDGKAPAS
jgi:ABC-2 type transport system ATP-binding protein